ncbi:MAG: DUF167 domain-containing protein [Deltaproteobacteria bacterium]|nr:DUF167 domain-containing protein [Deltaproteobacteria bacterium]
MEPAPICERGDGIEIACHVQPRASRSRLVGRHGNAIKFQLAAPPVDGAANRALIELCADLLGVAKSAVVVARGESSRHKIVRVRGVTADRARAVLLPR